MRAIVVNLGVYWHFAGDISPPVWALCLFVLPFSFAIAVLKDVPDLEGDRRFAIRTFTVRMGAERVFGIGLAALAIAYGGMIVLGPWLLRDYAQPVVLIGGHLAAAILLWYWARQADPARSRGLHALLHAGLGALLPGVSAGARSLPRAIRRQVENKLIGWPKRRGQASTGGVGLSAMSIASTADQQPRAGRDPGVPHQAFRPHVKSRTPSLPPRRAPHGGGRRGVTSKR